MKKHTKRISFKQIKERIGAILLWLVFRIVFPAFSLIGFLILLWLSGDTGDDSLKQQIFYMLCGDAVALAISIATSTFESSYKQEEDRKGFPFWWSLLSLFMLLFVNAVYFVKPINYYIKAERIETFFVILIGTTVVNTICGLYVDECKTRHQGDKQNEQTD